MLTSVCFSSRSLSSPSRELMADGTTGSVQYLRLGTGTAIGTMQAPNGRERLSTAVESLARQSKTIIWYGININVFQKISES